MEIKTKSRGGCCRLRLIGADGDASQKTSFPFCRHRHHQCHACMTTTAIMVQKAAAGRSKSPPLAVKKQLLVVPLSNSPQGARMPTWCGSHSGCVGWMEHEFRCILSLRKCSIYLIIYVSLCMGGEIYGVSL